MPVVSRRPLPIVALCALLLFVAAGCGGDDSTTTDDTTTTSAAEGAAAPPSGEDTSTKPKITVPDGPPPKQLEQQELVEGSGAEAKAGDEVTVNYVGVGYDSGEEFDASWGREPFPFQLGAGAVIQGWDKGVAGMKVGGRRELTIPPNLAYGPAGYPPAIGPNETLIFVIDLLAVN